MDLAKCGSRSISLSITHDSSAALCLFFSLKESISLLPPLCIPQITIAPNFHIEEFFFLSLQWFLFLFYIDIYTKIPTSLQRWLEETDNEESIIVCASEFFPSQKSSQYPALTSNIAADFIVEELKIHQHTVPSRYSFQFLFYKPSPALHPSSSSTILQLLKLYLCIFDLRLIFNLKDFFQLGRPFKLFPYNMGYSSQFRKRSEHDGLNPFYATCNHLLQLMTPIHTMYLDQGRKLTDFIQEGCKEEKTMSNHLKSFTRSSFSPIYGLILLLNLTFYLSISAPWVNRKKILANKANGGLVVGSIFSFNMVLLFK
ncbi:unnamed protein product [Lactuca saligna]|uniref:Uncharacterized protein n=1 Tax=Lactuca saligna TaxID=75948 RepID=A0AA35UKZ1_LACSI|nr:unnamed protein product [Lactuca saligna]